MAIGGAWPWLALAGLGMFHGLNPAMGWLFAVALGLHRGSRKAVLLALPPMALGHAVSIWLVATSVMALGAVIDAKPLHAATGAILVLWAAYHWLYGHRHRVRVGLTTGLAGLVLWSFLMATAHGAGLMLVPALMPLCAGSPVIGAGSLPVALAAVGVHTLATLAVTGLIAFVVYDWLGLAVLKRGWVNFDLLWTGALAATGLALTLTA
ncbi:hypothetical protein [Limobrevibacterium gyesilva]|uniref:Arginine/ornithine antiporter ArcD n=1 Tax=Limobrevibacterium gyesilva TaxID=2991712 RepID=A0AA41YUX7_9PROT|nr:hypothetical protein [Limobrevibacterium gyesilva]MCW3477023.1 hypothetical protein [Limobrevibacterium gyesilva]